MPTIKDLPAHIETFYVEASKARGVFGAQGVGEPPISAPGAAIASAVYNAVGVRIESLPITLQKILAAPRQS